MPHELLRYLPEEWNHRDLRATQHHNRVIALLCGRHKDPEVYPRTSSRAFSSTPDGKGQNLSLIFQSSYTLLLMRLNPEHRVIDACLLGVPPESPDTKMLTHRVFHLKLVWRHVVQRRKETFGIFTIHINPIIIILDLYSFIVIYCDYGKE